MFNLIGGKFMVYYCTLGAGLVVSTVFLFSRSKGASVKNLFLKMISSLFFILTAVCAVILNPKSLIYGALLIMGGVLGLCGDIALDLKYVYKKDAHAYLISGFLFFLVGHIFYSSAVVWHSGLKWWVVLLCAAISLVIGVGNIIVGEKFLKLEFGRYKFIVFLYTAFLVMTTAVSLVSAIITHEKSMILMTVGGILFLLSDAVLSNTYFGKDWDKPVYIFVNHLLYYAGQFFIASSILFLSFKF